MKEIRTCLHDTALLGGQHQDLNLDKHCYLLPHKYVGDFDALGPRLREVSAASDQRVAKLVSRLQKRFRGQPGEPNWWPYRGGQLDRGDPELARVAHEHGERAPTVVVRELAHIEAVGASGGYATVVEWDWQRDRRMDTHAAVEQLVGSTPSCASTCGASRARLTARGSPSLTSARRAAPTRTGCASRTRGSSVPRRAR